MKNIQLMLYHFIFTANNLKLLIWQIQAGTLTTISLQNKEGRGIVMASAFIGKKQIKVLAFDHTSIS